MPQPNILKELHMATFHKNEHWLQACDFRTRRLLNNNAHKLILQVVQETETYRVVISSHIFHQMLSPNFCTCQVLDITIYTQPLNQFSKVILRHYGSKGQLTRLRSLGFNYGFENVLRKQKKGNISSPMVPFYNCPFINKDEVKYPEK